MTAVYDHEVCWPDDGMWSAGKVRYRRGDSETFAYWDQGAAMEAGRLAERRGATRVTVWMPDHLAEKRIKLERLREQVAVLEQEIAEGDALIRT